MEPLAVSSITMGPNFELAQIWLGDGKAMRSIDEYIYFIFCCAFYFLICLNRARQYVGS